MNAKLIRDRLVEHGEKLFNSEKHLHIFTKVSEADILLNDLEKYPHAFVLGCVMDRQIKAEKAWIIPYRFSQKLGGFSLEILNKLSLTDVKNLMSNPEPLHRYVEIMSASFHSAIQRISKQYANDASQI